MSRSRPSRKEPSIRDEVLSRLSSAGKLITPMTPVPPRRDPATWAAKGAFTYVAEPHEVKIRKAGNQVTELIDFWPPLRTDGAVRAGILEIATDVRAGIGRWLFIRLLGEPEFVCVGEELAGHLEDVEVYGWVVSALYGMRAPGHSDNVLAYAPDQVPPWMREAIDGYVQWDSRRQ